LQRRVARPPPPETAQMVGVYSRLAPAAGWVQRRMPDDSAAAARELFAALRWFDRQGVRMLWIEQPPGDPAWEGVRDRLTRAAAA
jgi:L-threonylcarbamoyladenylate synthase